jgi:hypothetical protein
MPAEWTKKPPAIHDIVSAYFPETNPKGALQLRPCLVMDVLEDADSAGEYAVLLAFGTKNIKVQQRHHVDLIVQNHADMESMGLPYATRFALGEDDMALLPWDEESIGCWFGFPSPVIGFLDDEYQGRLQTRLARRKKIADKRASASPKDSATG